MNLPDDMLPAKAIVFGRESVRSLYQARTRYGNAPHDEMWNGTLVLYEPPDNEHQAIRAGLAFAFNEVVDDVVLIGANVADREAEWLTDFRCPDVVVCLATNSATDCDTHWVGGPDLAVEVVSPGEDARLKLAFYAKVNTRELLVVDRYPWKLELYQLQGTSLVSVGASDVAGGAVLTSCALPLTFQLQAGAARPVIHVAHTTDGRTWTA